MTKEQIHSAIISGLNVYWENTLYKVERIKVEDNNLYADPTRVNGYGLRATCISNGFGSLMTENCLEKCFLKNSYLLVDVKFGNGEVLEWNDEQMLEEINRDRSDKWTDYDEGDLLEGWCSWCQNDVYKLIEVNGKRFGC